MAERDDAYFERGAVVILDELIRRAVAARASDIHLEPKRDRMQVRMRVDGALVEEPSVPPDIAPAVVSRIKVLARMDIAERRLPQDGQLTVELSGKLVSLRASTFPNLVGEKVVLRLLVGHAVLSFDKLGLDAATQATVEEIARRPQGFFVTCGPTGSGKTSTLYACLNLIDTQRVNVVTLEDPVEVEVPNITQGQTHVKAGFTFAAGLRAILRQDPDVIMVGEIRDSETAGIALQAALTGHMVFTTLHTSDTVETVVRLIDLGVEPWIVANALTCVLAQRLVRLPCSACQDGAKLEIDLWDGDELLLPAGSRIMRPRGCAKCFKTGYRGRTGIFEVLVIDDDVRELVKSKAGVREYRELFAKRKIKSLRRIGYERVLKGATTVDEVLRVT
ncbi:MAG: type II/IV secretion system protein [Myxococcales bacterium]|jgi:general secretion pathway protein E/type IV pilus assembly protein PilB|nr:type II/IV secretion system protein [Myxococcales bacterium]